MTADNPPDAAGGAFPESSLDRLHLRQHDLAARDAGPYTVQYAGEW